MNCREFRQHHDSYIDDTLPGLAIDGMQNHLRFCAECSRHDTRIRRALIVARNVPLIQPSADFGARLQARLREEHLAGRSIQTVSHERFRRFSPGASIMIASGVFMVIGLAGVFMLPGEQPPLRLAPVIASAPVADTTFAAPTMVSAVSAVSDATPLWPAAYVPEQSPWHLVSNNLAH